MWFLSVGKILFVDLTNGIISKEPLAPYNELFFGGKGINTKIMYDKVGPEVKPFDPDNVIAFGTGPLTGTPLPGSGKMDVSTKSPETNILGSAAMGGFFGPELKFAGYDHLVITGKANKPVYLYIENDYVEIRDGINVWGKDTLTAQEIIRDELNDPEVQIVTIGPAAEKLVVFSTVHHALSNTASRTGIGAVMGSKNLKAVAVRGTKGIKIAEPEKFLAISQKINYDIRQTPQHKEWSELGVTKLIDYYYNADYGPVNNAQSYVWDKNWPCSTLCIKYSYQRYGCFNCPIHCMECYNVEGVGVGVMSCQPYLEITSRIGNHDYKAGMGLMMHCQRLGIENITAMALTSMLMEMRQRGLITDKDTDGIPMEWGNIDSVIKLMYKIANREGIGNILADGMVPAAKAIGRGAEYYAHHTKGLPHYALNQHSFVGQGLGTAIAPRGDYVRTSPDLECCSGLVGHMGEDEQGEKENRAYYDEKITQVAGSIKGTIPTEYEGKAKMVAYAADHNNACDQTSVCKWLTPFFDMPIDINIQAEALTYGFGKEVITEDILTASRRLETLVRAYNCREGITRRDDNLPERYFKEEIPSGIYKGFKQDRAKFEQTLDEYYTLRGWDLKTGVPTRETLEKFGLQDVADDLEKRARNHLIRLT